MVRKLLIRDLTLSDGLQKVLAARMSQEQISRLLPYYREAGFYAMEVWNGRVADTAIRYLNENPWQRLEALKREMGVTTRLTALSWGRNLLGYHPYSDEMIDCFSRNAIQAGVDSMRLMDALNDIDNLRSSIRYVKKYGGEADGMICYATDPHHSAVERIQAALHGHALHKPVFTDDYFLEKAQILASLGVDRITIGDLNGLMLPKRCAELVRLFKQQLKVPVAFHTHSAAGYGLASVLMAIINGADVIDTNIGCLAGGLAAPAVELVYVFCKKLGVELDINLEAIAMINEQLLSVSKELSVYRSTRRIPKAFNPLTDCFPSEIDRFFNDAIEAARKEKEDDLLLFCRAIESYFDYPEPNDWVMKAELPLDMYSEIASRLKQQDRKKLLEKALSLIPKVRMDAGLPPLVEPFSQIIGSQVVLCALNEEKHQPIYANPSLPFLALIKGEYGKTPLPINPAFRLNLTGQQYETPYDGSNYVMQENLYLDEQELLLLELFPAVARTFLARKKTT